MKYCSKCGKELSYFANACPACGCLVNQPQSPQTNYRLILANTKWFLTVGIVLLALGVFALVASSSLALLYAVIGEAIHDLLGTRPSLSMYHTCDVLGEISSTLFLLAAEIVFIIPKQKFNKAFKQENWQQVTQYGKVHYQQECKQKNREMNREVPGYKFAWILGILSCVLFVISIIV